MKRKIAIGITALIALGTLSGCTWWDDPERGFGDATADTWDDSGVHAINMPNRFMNVAFKCFGVNGIYSHTRAAAPVVIPNDPMCLPDATFQVTGER